MILQKNGFKKQHRINFLIRQNFMDTLSILDFSDNIQKSFLNVCIIDREYIECQVFENFEKGFIDEDVFLCSLDILEKGRKKVPVGTIRNWKAREYIKTDNGWTRVEKKN